MTPDVALHAPVQYGLGRPARRRQVALFLKRAYEEGKPIDQPEYLGSLKTKVWQL